MDHKPIIVSGATNQVGYFLLHRLLDAGYPIHAISRTNQAAQKVQHKLITWQQIDFLGKGKVLNASAAQHFLHLAPIWLLNDIIDNLYEADIRRIIAISSTSRYSKVGSANSAEQEMVQKIMAAENSLVEKCDKFGIKWTLLRPTMIYGCGMDRNVTVIAHFIKRFGFFPLVGIGCGCRQPVHADDVALACFAILNCTATYGRAYNLTGGQTLTFREMVEGIFQGLGKKTRIVSIPKYLVFFLMRCAALIPSYRHINPEMMERVNRDICFDSSDARQDFGYSPRGFHYE